LQKQKGVWGAAPGIAAAGGEAGKTSSRPPGRATLWSHAAALLLFAGEPTTAESLLGAPQKNR